MIATPLLILLVGLISFGPMAYSKEVMYERPIRDISIIASGESFYPNHISAFVGETLRLYVTTTKEKGGCFYLQKTPHSAALKLGEIESFTVSFDRPGEWFYFCPSNGLRGKIQVIRHPDDIRKENEKAKQEARLKTKWQPKSDTYYKEPN